MLYSDTDFGEGTFEEQCERFRNYLRAEVDRRLRELAKSERVELACRRCGEPTDVSQSHAEKVTHGRVPPPLCLDCRSPARAAETDAEAVRFVELFDGSPEEIARAVAALS